MAAIGVEGFDMICCPMVLLHLQDPVRALERIRTPMWRGATIVARDVEDGMGFAWPDGDGRFERHLDILDRDSRMGGRRCGGKAYGCLRRAGYENVRIERQGLKAADADDAMDLYRVAIPSMLD